MNDWTTPERAARRTTRIRNEEKKKKTNMKTDHPAGRIHRRRRHLHHRVEVPTFVQPRGPRVVEVRNVDDNESDVDCDVV